MTRRHRAMGVVAAVIIAVTGCGTGQATPSGPTGTASVTSQPGETATTAASPSISASPGATARPATTAPAAGALSWTLLGSGGGPAARDAHTWTVDPGAEVAYLFGGRAGDAVLGDLWAYDLALDAWSAVTPQGATPPARFGHNAVWVPELGLVIFGGQAGSTFYNDLWAYDTATNSWRQLPADGDVPLARYGSCATLGPDGRLWISHGFTADQTRYSDTRAYDFAAQAWTDETPSGAVPVARCLHGCFWSVGGEQLALYGGQKTGTTALGDLWTLTPTNASWTVLPDPPVPARNLFALAQRAGDVVIFGGQGLDGGYLADVFRFDAGLAAVPIDVVTAPPGRAGAQLIDDATGDRVLLFGGANADGALGDLWELSVP